MPTSADQPCGACQGDTVPDADARLRELLGQDPPAAVLALPEADRAALAELVADARRRQFQSMQVAFDATLKHVPFPVRKVVKKVLGS